MRTRIPGWVGWPGTGPTLGNDWLPGPALRLVTLVLIYAFLALALTVNYVYGVTFFLLAIIGTYVGLRRGFVNGLTPPEKLMMAAFAAYPIVAIISYLVGTQTNVGFRFLGRDLRFLLFIPIYLAVRWSRPGRRGALLSFAVSIMLAFVVALWQVHQGPEHARARGVAGDAISFGDLALLTGWLAALLLVRAANPRRPAIWAAVLFLLAATISTSLLSGSRGGWIAIPLLAAILIAAVPRGGGRMGAVGTAGAAVATLGALAIIPGNVVHTRVDQGLRNVRTYIRYVTASPLPPSARSAACLNQRTFLVDLAAATDEWTPGSRIPVRVVDVGDWLRSSGWAHLCHHDFALRITVSAAQRGWTTVLVPRSTPTAGRQVVSILARGSGVLRGAERGTEDRFKNRDLAKVAMVNSLWGYGSLAVSVAPGSVLTFIPLQTLRGSYYYFYAANSVGVRLEMWRLAAHYWYLHPWLGIGAGAYQGWTRRLIADGEAAPGLWGFEHAHSDYMTTLATGGGIGFLALLWVYLAPLYASHIFRRRRRGNHEVRGTDLSWQAAVGAMMIFSLTETLFSHSLVISWYVVIVSVLAVIGFTDGANKAADQVGWSLA